MVHPFCLFFPFDNLKSSCPLPNPFSFFNAMIYLPKDKKIQTTSNIREASAPGQWLTHWTSFLPIKQKKCYSRMNLGNKKMFHIPSQKESAIYMLPLWSWLDDGTPLELLHCHHLLGHLHCLVQHPLIVIAVVALHPFQGHHFLLV